MRENVLRTPAARYCRLCAAARLMCRCRLCLGVRCGAVHVRRLPLGARERVLRRLVRRLVERGRLDGFRDVDMAVLRAGALGTIIVHATTFIEA